MSLSSLTDRYTQARDCGDGHPECLCAGKGCLPLSGRSAVDLSVHSGRAWQDNTPLLDDGVSEVPPAIAMYDWAGAADPTLGTRAPAGGRSGA